MPKLFSRLFRIWLSKGCENCEISSLGMSVACCQSWAFDKTQENCCRLGCNDWLSWKHQCVHRIMWLWRGRQLWCFVMPFLGHPWSMDYHSTPCWVFLVSFTSLYTAPRILTRYMPKCTQEGFQKLIIICSENCECLLKGMSMAKCQLRDPFSIFCTVVSCSFLFSPQDGALILQIILPHSDSLGQIVMLFKCILHKLSCLHLALHLMHYTTAISVILFSFFLFIGLLNTFAQRVVHIEHLRVNQVWLIRQLFSIWEWRP